MEGWESHWYRAAVWHFLMASIWGKARDSVSRQSDGLWKEDWGAGDSWMVTLGGRW